MKKFHISPPFAQPTSSSHSIVTFQSILMRSRMGRRRHLKEDSRCIVMQEKQLFDRFLCSYRVSSLFNQVTDIHSHGRIRVSDENSKRNLAHSSQSSLFIFFYRVCRLIFFLVNSWKLPATRHGWLDSLVLVNSPRGNR